MTARERIKKEAFRAEFFGISRNYPSVLLVWSQEDLEQEIICLEVRKTRPVLELKSLCGYNIDSSGVSMARWDGKGRQRL